MKTTTLNFLVFMAFLITCRSASVFATDGDRNDERDDSKNDYAYYIMSPKTWSHNDNDDDKTLRIFSKAGEVKYVNFKGTIQIPETLRANTGLLREGNSQAVLIIDSIQCTYSANMTKKFFNSNYGFVSCTDGSRVREEVRVDSKVGIYLKDVKGTPATLYASIKVSDKYVKGIKLPQLDASKGQILRFDGELWVTSNYIPDGQTAGDVLLWDGSTWMATKLSGSGAQGAQGPIGLTGPQGAQGLPGLPGADGLNGADGARGPQGLTGPAGATGAQGLAGAKGDTGAIGPQGLAGAKGDTGAIGPQGLTGPAGATGAQGLAGAKGDIGAVGPQGLAGAKGDTGAVGPQGLIGAAGAIGAQGLAGAKGDTGAVGPQGLIGAAGATGAQGLAGAKGDTGAIGPQGLAGAKGDKGDTGLTGAQGLAGDIGTKGDKGDKGDTGLSGPQGAQGLIGLTGAAGAQGLKGDNGDPGIVSLTAGSGIVGGTILGNGGTIAVNTGTAAGQIPVIDATGKLAASIIPDVSSKIVFIKDIKANGVNGGSCDSAKGWEQIRDLNSISGDTTFATLAANQITLAAGTYIIDANAPAYLDGFHKAALVNASTSEFVLFGSNARTHNVAGGMEPSVIMGQITVTVPTTFVIKHRCSSVMANIGLGVAMSFGVEELYTQMKITKIK